MLCCFLTASCSPQQATKNLTAADGIILALSDEAHAAVDAGVALSFKCWITENPSKLWFTEEKNDRLHVYILTRHSLSNRYIVSL